MSKWMTIAKDLADLVLKVLSSIAIVVAGIWALYQYFGTDSDASNIQLTVTSEVKPYGEGQRLLVLHVRPKNIGKVPVTPGKAGLMIATRQIPLGLSGVVDIGKQPISFRTNLLSHYPDGYLMEPGIEYDEVLALVVPKGAVIAAEAELDLGDGDMVNQIHVVDAN